VAKYRGPVCRLCRREGEKLFLKGSRCMTENAPLSGGVILLDSMGKNGRGTQNTVPNSEKSRSYEEFMV
jgi:small subunit ribosomal protein S4